MFLCHKYFLYFLHVNFDADIAPLFSQRSKNVEIQNINFEVFCILAEKCYFVSMGFKLTKMLCSLFKTFVVLQKGYFNTADMYDI